LVVLSLFDGIGGALVALTENLKIPIKAYYIVEKDPVSNISSLPRIATQKITIFSCFFFFFFFFCCVEKLAMDVVRQRYPPDRFPFIHFLGRVEDVTLGMLRKIGRIPIPYYLFISIFYY
jgi:hypothetical protein